MKPRYVIITLSFLFTSVMDSYSQKITSKSLPNNPTSYIFKIKVEEARFTLEKSYYEFGGLSLYIHDIYYRGKWKRSSWPDVARNALSGDANKNDVWMQVSVDSSDVYFNKKGKPLGYEMECLVHFTAIDSTHTKMEIKVLNAKVHVRDRLLPSPPHFENNPVYKTVKPTTIEEYKILQCMGKELGVFDRMPPLRL
jgi:hypothetical protein